MIRYLSAVRHRCFLVIAIAAAAIAAIPGAEVATEVESAGNTPALNTEMIKGVVVKPSKVKNTVHERQMKYIAKQNVADPEALVAAVKYSTMPNLLISVAIEESRGNPVAVGSAGELGAWQVKASHWGFVPKDIHGQAGQAESIISNLLTHTKGNKKNALAHYNGGTTPPVKSYRYAERVLKRARHLQVAANHPPVDYTRLRQALLDVSGDSRML